MSTDTVTGARALLASLATALSLAALMLVPSELIRLLCPRTMRRRVFAPRLARQAASRRSLIPSPPLWPFSWLVVALAVDDTEQSVVDELGLDAAVYIGTARLGLRIILATAWFDLGVVLPLNYAGDYSESGASRASDLDRFTMAHVPPRSPLLWAHAASTVLKTAATLALLQRFSAWVQAQQLRARRAATAAAAPAQRTVLVTQVPHDADVASAFRAWYGDALERVTPVADPALLSRIVAEKAALTVELAAARRALDAGGARPLRRVPAWLPWGEQVDALDFCAERLLVCDSRLAAARRGVLGSPPERSLLRAAAFVTFRQARSATVAGQVVHGADAASWRCAPAPEPGNVLWANVGRYTAGEQLALQTCAWGATLGLCSLFLALAAAIQSFAYAASLARAFPPARAALANAATQSLVEGVLPGILLFILAWIWPIFLRLLTVWQGAATWADVDRGMTSKSFLFNVLIAFVSTVLSGAVWSGLKEVVNAPSQLPQLLAVKIPATSRFFMTYTILQGVGGNGGMLARWWPALQYAARVRAHAAARRGARNARSFGGGAAAPRRLAASFRLGSGSDLAGTAAAAAAAAAPASPPQTRTASTPADAEDDDTATWPPFHQPFGRFFPRILLQIQILVVFSTIAPLMQAVALLYFIPALAAAKVKMMYHHEKQYEGYGRMWPLVRSLVCAILLVYQLTMAGLLGLKGGVYPAWVTGVACIPATLLAMRKLAVRYNPSMYGAVPIELHAELEQRKARRSSHSRHADANDANDALPPVLPTPQLESVLTVEGASAAALAAELRAARAEAMLTPPPPLRLPSCVRRSETGPPALDTLPPHATSAADAQTPPPLPARPSLPPPQQRATPSDRRRLPYLLPDLDVDEALADDAALTRRFGRRALADVVLRGLAAAGKRTGVLGRVAAALTRRARALGRLYCGLLVDRVETDHFSDDEEGASPPPSSAAPSPAERVVAVRVDAAHTEHLQ